MPLARQVRMVHWKKNKIPLFPCMHCSDILVGGSQSLGDEKVGGGMTRSVFVCVIMQVCICLSYFKHIPEETDQ